MRVVAAVGVERTGVLLRHAYFSLSAAIWSSRRSLAFPAPCMTYRLDLG